MATNAQIKEFVRKVRIEADTRNASKFADKTATVNTVKVNNTALSATDNAVNIDLSSYALKTDVTQAISGAYNTKGTVDSFADLPETGNASGDVYNILNAGGTDRHGKAIEAGVNVVYVEDETNPGWDALGGITDLSNYVEKETGKGLSTNDYTDADKLLLGSLSQSMDTDFTDADVTYVFNDDSAQAGGGGGREPETENTPTSDPE